MFLKSMEFHFHFHGTLKNCSDILNTCMVQVVYSFVWPFSYNPLVTENEKQRVQKRQEEIKKKLEISSNCSGYKIVCYCGKSMLLTTKNINYEEKSTNSPKRLKLDTYFNQALNIKYRSSIQETMVWISNFLHYLLPI